MVLDGKKVVEIVVGMVSVVSSYVCVKNGIVKVLGEVWVFNG